MPQCSVGSKGSYSVPIPQLCIRSGYLPLGERRGARMGRRTFHGRTSLICGGIAHEATCEGLILSALGTAGGLLAAYWCRHALVLLLPARSGVAMYLPGAIDERVMSWSAGICLIATLIVGLIPAFQTRNLDLAGPLKAESSGVVSARGRAWMRSGLVVFQVCLSFILLVAAALLLESLEKIPITSPGSTTTSVVTT